MTRIGIVGLAHVHAEAYARILMGLPGVDFVGVSERAGVLRERWSSSVGGRVFTDHEAMIALGLDAAIVCTQTNDHVDVVRQLADAHVDVLCEKPVATTLMDARAIVDVCSQAQIKLMTAFPMRFSPPLIEGATSIAQGRIGAVLGFTGINNGRIPTDHAAWFADPTAAGGGAVMDHTVHLADIMRWWLGAEAVEVYAETNHVIHPEVQVETGGIVTITFDTGVIATIDCSWSRPDTYPTWGGLSIEAVGTKGVVAVDAFAERLDVWTGNSSKWVDWGHDPNRSMIEHFVDAVRGDHPLIVTGVDGLRATEVALAAYRAVESGQPVEV